MTNESNGLAKILQECWENDAAKAAFINDPKAVLAAHGMDVPEEMDIKVVENSNSLTHIVLPANPSDEVKAMDLDDSELAAAVGGWNDSRLNCPHGSICVQCQQHPGINTMSV